MTWFTPTLACCALAALGAVGMASTARTRRGQLVAAAGGGLIVVACFAIVLGVVLI